MKYVLIQNIPYESASIHEFDTLTAAQEHLYEYLSKSYYDAEDYTMYEFVRELDINAELISYEVIRHNLYEKAIAKLSDEEISILGITKR